MMNCFSEWILPRVLEVQRIMYISRLSYWPIFHLADGCYLLRGVRATRRSPWAPALGPADGTDLIKIARKIWLSKQNLRST